MADWKDRMRQQAQQVANNQTMSGIQSHAEETDREIRFMRSSIEILTEQVEALTKRVEALEGQRQTRPEGE